MADLPSLWASKMKVRSLPEKRLLAVLSFCPLPSYWSHSSQDYLGVVPPDDAVGVLQDVHWSAGAIGYFPTYSLG